MVIKPTAELEAALSQQARARGIAPETLALDVLEERFLTPKNLPPQPQDEWERGLLEAARETGVSLPNEAFTSESLYD